ncbi:MAG TPA: homoserine kinase [Ignavibacteriaceae bacterium]|nr:homoserine kinase [Ignavibacteriaceae bacterium]
MKKIKAFAPASVTNVGSGFDVMGFAIENPGDEIILKVTDEPGIKITKITGDGGKLSKDPYKNTAGLSLISMVEHLEYKKGIEIELNKKMALGSGLGSSAASAVASVFAFNELLGKPLSKKELIKFALEGEKLTCGGTPHADNVAACMMGGFVIVRSISPIDVINIDFPKNLFCTIIHPHLEIITANTRKILRKHILLSDAVKQWGNVAGLVAGLVSSDYELIGNSLQDFIIEPVRSILIPNFYEVKNAALAAGAIGCSISGSGPSIFAFSKSKVSAEKVGNAMKQVLNAIGIGNDLYISKINKIGPKIIPY